MGKKVTVDKSKEAIKMARLHAGPNIPQGSEIMGMVLRDGIKAGALLKLKNGNLVQFNAGVIRNLPPIKESNCKLRKRGYLRESNDWIWAYSKSPNVELGIIPNANGIYDIQIGMGGEWWSGNVKMGNNVLHHRKEKGDEAYRPVKVIIKQGKDGVRFDISGGFYGDENAFFLLGMPVLKTLT